MIDNEQLNLYIDNAPRVNYINLTNFVYDKYNHREGIAKILDYLVSKGAKLDSINNGNIFPWALEKCSDELIEYFVKNGYEPDTTFTQYPIIPYLLDLSSFYMAKRFLEESSDKDPHYGCVPLVCFFADGGLNSSKVIDFLIKNKLNEKHYSKAFFNSILNNDLVSATLLLDAGADVNYIYEESELNALSYAKNLNTAQYLVDKGIDINNAIENIIKRSTLENTNRYIFRPNDYVLFDLLNELRIEINLPDTIKAHHLVYASSIGDIGVAEYFINTKADSILEKALIANAKYGFNKPIFSNKPQIDPTITKL